MVSGTAHMEQSLHSWKQLSLIIGSCKAFLSFDCCALLWQIFPCFRALQYESSNEIRLLFKWSIMRLNISLKSWDCKNQSNIESCLISFKLCLKRANSVIHWSSFPLHSSVAVPDWLVSPTLRRVRPRGRRWTRLWSPCWTWSWSAWNSVWTNQHSTPRMGRAPASWTRRRSMRRNAPVKRVVYARISPFPPCHNCTFPLIAPSSGLM